MNAPLRLLILRHGKAEPHRSPDFLRGLMPKGVRRTQDVAARAAELGLWPERVVTSPAPRALDTAAVAAEMLDLDPGLLRRDPDLYDCWAPPALWNVVRRHGGSVRTLLLCGHNPGLSELAAWLCPDVRTALPKSSLTVLEWDVDGWDAVRPGRARLRHFLRPHKGGVLDLGAAAPAEE
ncbi:MAG TPA: histidine phosphatase family protein [Candidatus Krumholzibacteria bacterium]|nr:histidine phosphatase family protein [Candidatus Krumholzibacteria bacterium]HRX51169.1 histidine phosphatase family protein [Candidatus Krumholzibacteria bacterium]